MIFPFHGSIGFPNMNYILETFRFFSIYRELLVESTRDITSIITGLKTSPAIMQIWDKFVTNFFIEGQGLVESQEKCSLWEIS